MKKLRHILTIALCIGWASAAVAAPEKEAPLKMVVNGDLKSTLQLAGTEMDISGRVSAHMEATPQALKEGLIEVRAFNIVYFRVPQEPITGRKSIDKETGTLGFAMTAGYGPQYLKYDPRSGVLYGDLEGQVDLAQIAQHFQIQADEKGDAFIAPSQAAVVHVKLQMDAPLALDSAAKELVQRRASLTMAMDADEAPDFKLGPYAIRTEEALLEIDYTIIYIFEIARKLAIQPVRIMTINWTGGFPFPILTLSYSGDGLGFGLPGAQKEWAKADVIFEVRDWKTLYSPANMVMSLSEANSLRSMVQDGDAIEVFFVDAFDPICMWGGGATYSSGSAAAQIITSDGNFDWGVDFTHLAHELGHVMALMHPGLGYPTATSPSLFDGSSGTLMCPSGCMNDNPAVNSVENETNVNNPLFTFAIKAIGPGPDCVDSTDCGPCY